MLRLFHNSIVPPVKAVQPGIELKPAQLFAATEEASNDPFTNRFVPPVGGAVVASTLMLNRDDAVLTLPATSVALAVKLCVPADSSVVATLQAPLAFAFAVPTCVVPSNNLTVLPASAEPDNVRALAVVILSPRVPVSGVNAVILGADGATVSGGVPTGGGVGDPVNVGGRSP